MKNVFPAKRFLCLRRQTKRGPPGSGPLGLEKLMNHVADDVPTAPEQNGCAADPGGSAETQPTTPVGDSAKVR